MKGLVAVILSLSVLVPIDAGALKGIGVRFGPQNCVTLSRSSAGSCVITTDCEGVDISQTEFAFDCIGQHHLAFGVGENHNGKVVRHSFGVGGFETGEEFDTEVKCSRCAGPTGAAAAPVETLAAPVVKKVKATLEPAPAHTTPNSMAHSIPSRPKAAPKIRLHAEDTPTVALHVKTAKAATKAKSSFWPFTNGGPQAQSVDLNPFDTQSQAVKYGPHGCVSVYKSKGHCIMSTDCDKKDMSNYEFGLVCVDKTGSPVKHLFGKDSFDEKESFDTLIRCDQCLGLEDIPDAVALAGEVSTMGKDIANLKAVMTNISINVQMLNKEVFPKAPSAPSPAPALAAAASPTAAKEEEVKKVGFHSVAHHRHHGNLRHAEKRHRHHHRYYDEDEDGDSDRDDDDDERYDDREEDEREQPPAPVKYVPLNDVEQRAIPMNKSSLDEGSNEDDEGSIEGSDED